MRAVLCHLVCAAIGASNASADAPTGLHVLAATHHADTLPSATLVGAPGQTILPLQTPATPKPLCRTVFGYLPYWEEADYLRYDLLSHLACFAVAVNEDGSLGNDHGWPWTSVINAAHAAGTKIILVATLFDPDKIDTLVTTPAYKSAFFVNIRDKMLEGSADGVNIDFEGSGSFRSHVNGFMAELTAYLHGELPGSEVTFAGPAVNWGNGWDLQGLADSCDGIFIMGYAFAGSWSNSTGPNSPLIGGSINITDTVLDEYAEVTRNSPEKLILGLPYYGHHWIAASDEPRAAVIDFLSSTRFYNDEPNSAAYGLLWDEVSQTPWYRWHDGTDWHQVWFDNAESLGLKYQLAKDVGLQGVGVWALGYDDDRDELWDELERRFGPACFALPDFDYDGDVDQTDFGHLQSCLTGSNVPQDDPACQNARLDDDADVDGDDCAVLQDCLSGAGVPADPGVYGLKPAGVRSKLRGNAS